MSEITNMDYPSPVMQKVLAACRQAAATLITVLLLGESGTGKDFLSKYIHGRSRRADGPFFSINCAAIPPELVESELFGHEKGAFTGSCETKIGLIELAQGGTLVLNEIGETPLSFQAKLLSVLDAREFVRVGGRKKVQVNVRIIAATNRDLPQMVSDGRFRRDLYYRLNVFPIVVPPLRERKEDIPLLAEQFLTTLAAEMGLEAFPSLEPAALETLVAYEWPGNVRELRNVLERALTCSGGTRAINSESLAFLGRVADHVIDLSPDPSSRTSIDLPAPERLQSQGGTPDPSGKRSILDNDEYFQRMIQELFRGKPTPTGAVAGALGCSRKTVSGRVSRMKLVPGDSGRMKTGMKKKIVDQVQQWIEDNPVG
jgi:transcriptional regulator with PAS, ATPase and Fis domain